jgi:hypothetical protein
MAESLPWSPHWEFGVSHWQLKTKLHRLNARRKIGYWRISTGSLAKLTAIATRGLSDDISTAATIP